MRSAECSVKDEGAYGPKNWQDYSLSHATRPMTKDILCEINQTAPF